MAPLSSSPNFPANNPFLAFDQPKTGSNTSSNSDSFMDMSEVAGQLPAAPSFGVFDSEPAVIAMQDDAKPSPRNSKPTVAAASETKAAVVPSSDMDMLDALDEFEDGLNEDYEDAATKIARVLVQAHEQGMETDSMGTQLAVSQLR